MHIQLLQEEEPVALHDAVVVALVAHDRERHAVQRAVGRAKEHRPRPVLAGLRVHVAKALDEPVKRRAAAHAFDEELERGRARARQAEPGARILFPREAKRDAEERLRRVDEVALALRAAHARVLVFVDRLDSDTNQHGCRESSLHHCRESYTVVVRECK